MKMEKNRGKFAEDYACEYLSEKGYEIIDRNYSGKQDRIRKTTEIYIDKNDLYEYQPRFDVIEIYLDNFKLNHYIDAF